MDKTFLMYYFVLPISIGVIVLVLGGVLWLVAARRKKKIGEIEIGDWETTGGKIISARIEKRESKAENKSGAQVDITYEPILDYVYVVKDIEHHGNTVFAGTSEKFDQKTSQEILDKYLTNTYVPVRYNPEDPTQSALMPHRERTNFIQMAGYLLTAFGLSVCCFTSFMAFIIVGNIK